MTLSTKKNKKTIGIPRGLNYYEHGKEWTNFFEGLGFGVITSNKTNKDTLNIGVKCCTNETCLPVKVFHGHVMELEKADYIFVPRYSSVCYDEYCCPKLCGLPDMVTYNLKNKSNLFEIKINQNIKEDTIKSLKDASKLLGVSFDKIIRVFENTIGRHLNNEDSSYLGIVPPLNKKKIALLGHPYMIYDEYLSMNLINKLSKQGYFVCTPQNIEPSLKRANAYPYNSDNRVFFSVGLDNLGSFYSFLDYENLYGIIYLTPFACGVDAVVVEFMERGLKKHRQIPFMKLTVDEHTGEAGFDTRVEAFLDMIE